MIISDIKDVDPIWMRPGKYELYRETVLVNAWLDLKPTMVNAPMVLRESIVKTLCPFKWKFAWMNHWMSMGT